MLILTNEILKDKQKSIVYIENEKKIIDSTIQIYKLRENSILNYISIFSEYTDSKNSINNDILVELLSHFKDALNLIQININLLTDMYNSFNNLIVDSSLDIDVNNFNDVATKHNLDISENAIKIETIMNSIPPLMQVVFSNSNNSSNLSLSVANDDITPEDYSIIHTAEHIKGDELDTTISNTNIVENTLVISESSNNVILPYHLDTLNDIFINNKNTYKNIEDVIKDVYTLPLDVFSNPVISRFKEAFKLMRIKEQKSIKDAFELGLELLFNYKLHPAIITACNNLDELDAYLDFLENNETHNFNCFNIVFDVAPTLTTK